MSLFKRDGLPLRHLKLWSPFKVDALGLVTLLGADEVNRNIGSLSRRRFTEYLPFLAALVIASDGFTSEQPGYVLYNMDDGIKTDELKGWFTRWLSKQNIRNSTAVFTWSVMENPQFVHSHDLVALAISVAVMVPLIICTCLMGDWFGVGNALAIAISIAVRKVLLGQLREGLNRAVRSGTSEPLPLQKHDSEKTLHSVNSSIRKLHRHSSQPAGSDIVTVFVTRADGKMVTIKAPRAILQTFYRDSPVRQSQLYRLTRWLGWLAFGCHIVVLGMSTLFTQIYTVVLLVLSTWAMCHDHPVGSINAQRSTVNGTKSQITKIPFTSYLLVEQECPAERSLDGEKLDRRMFAYVRAEPSRAQEDALRHWSMLPFESATQWYSEYQAAKAEYAQQKASRYAEMARAASSPQSSSASIGAGQGTL